MQAKSGIIILATCVVIIKTKRNSLYNKSVINQKTKNVVIILIKSVVAFAYTN